MKNLLVAQSGGPTSAINATLVGVLTTAMMSSKVDQIYGAVNGIQGVLENRLINLSKELVNTSVMDSLCMTPAAALGSCRLKLKDAKQDAAEYEQILQTLLKNHIGYFVYIGGNDSMDTVDKLSAYLRGRGIDDIMITGAPKTIDNDLVGTDHCPGFGSAAKYIGTTFAELERDCAVYAMKAVTIVEIMGRDTGWLTAASALSRIHGAKGPGLIYPCEIPFDSDRFIEDVREKLQETDSVLIAVSEGIRNADGLYISQEMQSDATDDFGHTYISGAARVLEAKVREQIGCKVRSIELNLMQRCAGHIRSSVDMAESKMLGSFACQCAIDGESGVMSAVIREGNHPYRVSYRAIPVSKVANKVRKVPLSYISERGNDVTEEMVEYLLPLIQGEAMASFSDGIPKYVHLY